MKEDSDKIDTFRKIIHIDMDAFYASVEQRDRPELKGKPVIVGGDPQGRGVVAACSYEARKFGIHSAMPARWAHSRCPHAVFLRPRFDVYKAVSGQIREIFFDYTDLVEPLSLDEAYLDVTQNKKGIPYATAIARQIRSRIFNRTGLTASAGVSFNKFLAKVASDVDKPDGLTVIPPEAGAAFIDRLPIGRFYGVGKVTERRMHDLDIRTGADLKRWPREDLYRVFGKAGLYFHDIAHGHDERPVETERVRKSVGKEVTLGEDIEDIDEMHEILQGLSKKVEAALRNYGFTGTTVTLKIRYTDFRCITRSITLGAPVTDADAIMAQIRNLLKHTDAGAKKVRLLGITLSNFAEEHTASTFCRQLPLPLIWETG